MHDVDVRQRRNDDRSSPLQDSETEVVHRRRLATQDALWLEMDRPNNLMVVDSLVWTATPIDWERFRRVARARLWDRYPAFRSCVVGSRDGAWFWEEQQHVDFDDQISHVDLPAPGGVSQLQELIAAERTVPLERSRPLWKMYCIDGFNGGSALFTRTHHAIADGIRMVQLAMSLFDATPTGGAVIGPAVVLHAEKHDTAGGSVAHLHHWPASQLQGMAGLGGSVARTLGETVTRLPSAAIGHVGAAAVDAIGRWADLAPVGMMNPLAGFRGASTRLTSTGESLGAWLRSSTRQWVPAAGKVGAAVSAATADADFVRKLVLGTRNDIAPWTGPVGSHKAVAWSEPLPLTEVKRVARAHGVTVNDVLVACVAGTLPGYLVDHGATCGSVNWMIPVNLRPLAAALPEELGNSFAIVQLEMPTGDADPLAVLATVHQRMERIKRGHEAVAAFGIQELLSGVNRTVYRTAVEVLASRAVGVLTNVPGPPVPVYLAGERVEGMVGWAPLSGDQPMSFTIYSYDQKVFVGIACDAGLVPDHEQVVNGFAHAFQRLVSDTEPACEIVGRRSPGPA